MVVATKFPSYVVRHPEKRVWLVHQFRQAYELDRTELGQFGESPEDRALRRQVQELDRVALGEATRLFATSQQRRRPARALDGARAPRCCRIRRRTLAYRCDGYGDFVLSASRLDRAKRIDLLLEAAALEPGAPRRRRRRRPGSRASRGHRSRARARRARRVSRARLRRGARRSLRHAASPCTTRRSTRTSAWARTSRSSPSKPVITTTDAGGPARRRHRPARRGSWSRRRPRTSAQAAAWLRDHPDDAATFGRAGKALADEVTWDRAIARLLS